MEHPFTEKELFEVMRRFLPAEQAREVALAATIPANERSAGAITNKFAPAEETDFSFDTLVMLSLLSEETREKVERWRRRFGRNPTPDEERIWTTRRAELMEWAKDGYRTRE
jgi:hypothetical protein